MVLKIGSETCNQPPRNAAGIDAKAKGQNNFPRQCPALQKNHTANADTKIFSTSAVGFIITGGVLSVVLGHSLRKEGEYRHEGSELIETNV